MKKDLLKWLMAGLILISVTALVAFFSIGSSKQGISFNEEVRPILNESCVSCHGGVKKSGSLSLLEQESAFAKGEESGVPAIIAGKPEESELMRRVMHHDPEERMPMDGEPLQEKEINILRQWIREGAKWDRHWAWIAPDRKLPAPAVSRSWGNNGIDAFVRKRLKSEGLKPAPEADRETLIRRASLDLIGLPATPEQVQAFVEDQDPNAFEKVVDRLLKSPHFGERWASMWMDLARYGDSQGYQKDPIRLIWTYRDWLISAFNEDMPFDQFTIEQLAGDLLENPEDAQLIATAFHRNTMSNDEGGTDDEEFRVAAVIDRINTTFEIWQGITMGCVQCHSHPYDPFPHKSYYELMAFFNNTKDADRTDEFPTFTTFSPLEVDEVESITAWIGEHDPKVKYAEKSSLRDMRTLAMAPLIPVKAASSRHKLEISNRRGVDVATKVEDGSYLAFRNLNFSEIGYLSFAYVSGGRGGTLEARLDRPDGELIAELPITPTGKWARRAKEGDWKMLATEQLNVDGRHSLYLVFRGKPESGICDVKGFSTHPRVLNNSVELAAELAEKRLRLHELKLTKTPVMQDLPLDSSRRTYLFERGNWMVHGEEVLPQPPATLAPFPDNYPRNRLGLAQWLVSPENPLTARVTVNRFWEQLFGIGLIETLEDFGSQGEKPSHPELLDWLAIQFQDEHQWSMKGLLKDMVMSATYRQTAEVDPGLYQRDPKNRLLARGPRFRMTAEQIRDQALAVSGLLSNKMYGPSVMPAQPEGTWQVIRGVLSWTPSGGEDRYRRALYTFWRKSSPFPSMMTFDTPSREFCVSRRIRTNTPLQALVGLNDTVFVEAAMAFAQRITTEGGDSVEEQLKYGYRLAMGKEIEPENEARLKAFYERTLDWYAQRPEETCEVVGRYPESPTMAAWINTANVMMNLDEFFTKE